MIQSRYRIQRCERHGIAIGLCEATGCVGSAQARAVDRHLVPKIQPLRCQNCKQERGDAIKRGPFFGSTSTHPGYQQAWCEECWTEREARETAAATRRTVHSRSLGNPT